MYERGQTPVFVKPGRTPSIVSIRRPRQPAADSERRDSHARDPANGPRCQDRPRPVGSAEDGPEGGRVADDYFWAAVSLAVLAMLVGLLIVMIADDLRNAKRGSV